MLKVIKCNTVIDVILLGELFHGNRATALM